MTKQPQGRPRVDDADRLKHRPIRMTDDLADYYKASGDGNLSLGARTALYRLMEFCGKDRVTMEDVATLIESVKPCDDGEK